MKQKIILGISISLFFLILALFFILNFVSAEEIEGLGDALDLIYFGNSTLVEFYVGNIITQKNLSVSDIQLVSEVDFNSLPKEITIEKIGSNNLVIYEIVYKNEGTLEKVFVVATSPRKIIFSK